MVVKVIDSLAPRLRNLFVRFNAWHTVEEIRLRINKPIVIHSSLGAYSLEQHGNKCQVAEGYCITEDDLNRTIGLMTSNSWYALEDEIRSGYLTLPGGHRVGLTGKTILDKGNIKTLKYLGSINIRLARQILGAADSVMPRILRSGVVRSTVLISPPGCGKTTLLRDIARQISNCGINVVIIDERSEIAACHQGVPQLDVGLQTDVLDGCPKASGITMALRGMSPQVIITDEIGRLEDGPALADVMRAGVKVITSCHGAAITALHQRVWLKQCEGVFEQAVVLSRKSGPGTIEGVLKLNSDA